MSTLDVVNQAGGKPANFLDAGGGASAESMAEGIAFVLSDPAVKTMLINIFGGITRCDDVARGVLGALDQLGDVEQQLVVRLDGTNAEEGRRILAEANHPKLQSAEKMIEAAEKAVALAEGQRRSTVSIIIDENTKVVVQGIGSQGTFHAKRNKDYGTKVVAGVHPKKGGTTWEGLDVPVFADTAEAVAETGANTSMIMVPAPFTKDAILEAYEAGISTIVCITEGVPVHDMAEVYNTLYPRAADGSFDQGRAPGAHRPELPRAHLPGQGQRRDHPDDDHEARQGRPRVALRDADLPDHARAQPGRDRHLDLRRHRR
jgi:acyl-CoA synthetase (NDP forming)